MEPVVVQVPTRFAHLISRGKSCAFFADNMRAMKRYGQDPTIPEYAACLQFRRIVRTMAFRQAFAYSMGVSAPDRVIPVPAPLPNVPEGYLFTSYIASFETLPG